MNRHDDTLTAGAGIAKDDAFGAVIPPLHLSANFSFASFDQKRAYDYTRSGNPTRDLLAETLAELEGGAGAVIVSSGMAAIDLVLNLLPTGARVVAPHDCYGGSWRLFTARASKRAIEIVFVDQTDLVAVETALAGDAALLWIETPSNPLMRVVDIAALAVHGKAAGALVAVDNTFLSPVLQKPLRLGTDIVVHSTTKYLNGHSDVVGGAVVAADARRAEELAWWANCTGVTGAPFDAWLTLRGLRTLGVRLERQQTSALTIARALERHPLVRAVHYPGLESHPGHKIARAQQAGFGGMLSFELAGGGVSQMVNAFKLFTLAESLGGVESLVAHPATMTHASMSAEAREAAGISANLLRLSVGLEHAGDLWADLEQALARASPLRLAAERTEVAQ